MDAYTQDRRLLRMDTVLGHDHVLLVSVHGRDSLSACFSYDLELASTDPAIKPDDLLGTAATIWLNDGAGLSMPVNGIISRFTVVQRAAREISIYRVRLVPSLWLLTRTSDCRIFQDKTVPQIVDIVLGDYGISQKAWRLHGEHRKHDYCVQYRETAYDFICRLLEEEGICFFFLHDDRKHTVVFTDNNRGLAKCSTSRIVFSSDAGVLGGIWEWESAYQFRSGKWALSDYNFETPSTNLTTDKKTINPVLAKQSFEMFDYPGRYEATGPGATLAKLRIEYEESAYQEVDRRECLYRLCRGHVFHRCECPRPGRRQGIRAALGRAHRRGLEPCGAGCQAGELRQSLSLRAAHRAVPAGDEDPPSPHSRHADRCGDRAGRGRNLHGQVRPDQGAVLLGPAGQEERPELLLDPGGAELGRAQLRHMVPAAHRPGGRGDVPGGRSRPAAGGGFRLQRRADGAVRAARQQDAERAAHALVAGRQLRRTSTSSASRTRRDRNRSFCTRRRISIPRSSTTRRTGWVTTRRPRSITTAPST